MAPKRNAPAAAPADAGRRGKRTKRRSKKRTFVWKPRSWVVREVFKNNVSVVASRTNYKQMVVKKVLRMDLARGNDPRPLEIRLIDMLPACNRIVKPIAYSPSDPDGRHATAIFEYYPLQDVFQWKDINFNEKRGKPIPESYIWRFFVQMSQALAVVQNQLGPGNEGGSVLLHRDIKPENVMVVDNGTTYPSFKLHDFGCGVVYRRTNARKKTIGGSLAWQPPENPVINTKAADIWALGACVHFLAVGEPPIGDYIRYAEMRLAENGDSHPASATRYGLSENYYLARVDREVIPINLSWQEQNEREIAVSPTVREYNPQYSDELNKWMTKCLNFDPSKRPTARTLITDMAKQAEQMLRKIGGQAALTDLEVKFGD